MGVGIRAAACPPNRQQVSAATLSCFLLPDPCACRCAPQILVKFAQGLMLVHKLETPLIHYDVTTIIFTPAALPDQRVRLGGPGYPNGAA